MASPQSRSVATRLLVLVCGTGGITTQPSRYTSGTANHRECICSWAEARRRQTGGSACLQEGRNLPPQKRRQCQKLIACKSLKPSRQKKPFLRQYNCITLLVMNKFTSILSLFKMNIHYGTPCRMRALSDMIHDKLYQPANAK